MRRQEKANRIGAILDVLYPETPTPLSHESPYTLLVAVLLSAQCTDKRVNAVTPELFALADTPEAMSALDASQIEAIIKPCGLGPVKSRRIRALSEKLVTDFDGEVPDTLEALESLPGIGHKTASVVVTQAFGKPAFPVDTHIHRLAQRWGLTRANQVEGTERDLKKLFDRESWARRHLQIIFFGREFCPARGHDLRTCLICSWTTTKKRVRQELGAAAARSWAQDASPPNVATLVKRFSGRGLSPEVLGRSRG